MRMDLQGVSYGGSTRIFRDGVPLDLGPIVAGNPQVWNDNPLFATGSDAAGWKLATWPPLTIVAEHGQNHLFASAGSDFWAAQLGGVYHDSRGLVRSDWAVVAVDDVSPRAAVVVDGGLHIWDGVTLTLVDADGADTWESGDIHFSRGILGYRKHGRLVTWGRSNPVQVPGVGVRFDGDYVLCWQEGRGLVLHTWNSSIGIVLSTGDNFNPDIRDLGNGHVRIVAGINQGDEGEHRYDVDWNARTVNGEARPIVDLSSLPAPVFEPPKVERFHRRVGVLPFFVNHPRYRDQSGFVRPTPGHGQILNDHADWVDDTDMDLPIIADPTCSDSVPNGDLYAIFGDDRYGIVGDASEAAKRSVPLVLYHDGPDYPVHALAALRQGDVLCVQAYLQPGESPRAAAKRIGDTVVAVGQRHPRIALAWMSYAPAPFALADVLALQPLLVEIVRANPAIKLILPFAWARPSGCLDHPELAAWVRALVAASDGLPDLSLPAPKPEPKPPATKPPTEPAPESYIRVKEFQIMTTPEIVGAVQDGLIARVDPAQSDRINFDRTSIGPDEQIEITEPGPVEADAPEFRYALRFVRANKIICGLGAPDAPIGSYVRLFELRDPSQRGPSEAFCVATTPSGLIVAFSRYRKGGRTFTSQILTLVRQ